MFKSPLFIVAKFEVKTLLRSWFFRIFSAIAVLFLLFFNLMANTEVGDAGFADRMISGGLPYVNLWFLNIAQSIIAVFLSSDFLSRDKKLDTTEVIYVRSMSNFEYVFGKTLGILYVFGGLNLLVLCFTFITNIVSPDAGFSIITYIIYPFVISLPTLIFVLGVSFYTMQLIKNQAVTFILVLGYIATCLFYLQEKVYGITDFITFYTPLAYSSYVGFGNFDQLLFVRGGYFILGLALMFLSVAKLPRLSQTKKGKIYAYIFAFIFLFFSLFGFGQYYFINYNFESEQNKQRIAEYNLPLQAGYKISHYDIEIEHENQTLKGKIQFKVNSKNGELPEKLNFYFNNGLKISSLKIEGEDAAYNRQMNFLKVTNNLKSDSLSILMKFEGKPSQDYIYFNIGKNKKQSLNRFDPIIASKNYLYTSNKYLLLTKECFWYPVVAERNAFRINQFFTSNIKVKGKAGLTYLSQGEKSIKDGYTFFKGDSKYPKLSLVASAFSSKEITVDSIKYQVLLNKENWFYDDYFLNIQDTLPNLINRIKGDFERKIGLKYPYKRFTLVEVPIHFYSYYRPWMLTNENTHPEMIFVPEKGMGINQFNLARRVKSQERRLKRNGTELLPVEKETEIFLNLIGNSFALPEGRSRFWGRNSNSGRTIRDWSTYSVFPLFYNYSYSVEDEGLPYLNMCLENYMVARIHNNVNRFGSLSGNDKSILYLKQQNDDLVSLIDKEDKGISTADILLTVGNTKFAMAQQSIGFKKFDSFIDSLLKVNKGKAIEPSELKIKIPDNLKNRPKRSNEKRVEEKLELPAFLFGESKMVEVNDNNRKKYFVYLEVANKGNVDGLIQITLMRGGRGNRRNQDGGQRSSGGRRNMSTSYKDIYKIEKGANNKIGILLNRPPRMMMVHTFLSENVPSDYNVSLADFEKADNNSMVFEGLQELNYKIEYKKDNEIIVDNEDEGFSVVNTQEKKTLREIIKSYQAEDTDDNEIEYKNIRIYRPESKWTPVLNSNMHGRFLKSIMYKKSGDGSGKVQFVANIIKSGNYKVFAKVPSKRYGTRRREKFEDVEYHYTVHHDDGIEEVSIAIEEDGFDWVELGEFYFSEGKARVELSDKTTHRIVVADAVKWVKI